MHAFEVIIACRCTPGFKLLIIADQYFKYLYLKYVFKIHLKYFVFVFEIHLYLYFVFQILLESILYFVFVRKRLKYKY